MFIYDLLRFVNIELPSPCFTNHGLSPRFTNHGLSPHFPSPVQSVFYNMPTEGMFKMLITANLVPRACNRLVDKREALG